MYIDCQFSITEKTVSWNKCSLFLVLNNDRFDSDGIIKSFLVDNDSHFIFLSRPIVAFKPSPAWINLTSIESHLFMTLAFHAAILWAIA